MPPKDVPDEDPTQGMTKNQKRNAKKKAKKAAAKGLGTNSTTENTPGNSPAASRSASPAPTDARITSLIKVIKKKSSNISATGGQPGGNLVGSSSSAAGRPDLPTAPSGDFGHGSEETSTHRINSPCGTGRRNNEELETPTREGTGLGISYGSESLSLPTEDPALLNESAAALSESISESKTPVNKSSFFSSETSSPKKTPAPSIAESAGSGSTRGSKRQNFKDLGSKIASKPGSPSSKRNSWQPSGKVKDDESIEPKKEKKENFLSRTFSKKKSDKNEKASESPEFSPEDFFSGKTGNVNSQFEITGNNGEKLFVPQEPLHVYMADESDLARNLEGIGGGTPTGKTLAEELEGVSSESESSNSEELQTPVPAQQQPDHGTEHDPHPWFETALPARLEDDPNDPLSAPGSIRAPRVVDLQRDPPLTQPGGPYDLLTQFYGANQSNQQDTPAAGNTTGEAVTTALAEASTTPADSPVAARRDNSLGPRSSSPRPQQQSRPTKSVKFAGAYGDSGDDPGNPQPSLSGGFPSGSGSHSKEGNKKQFFQPAPTTIQPLPTTRPINMAQVVSDPKLRNSGMYLEQWKYLTGDDSGDPQPSSSGGLPSGSSSHLKEGNKPAPSANSSQLPSLKQIFQPAPTTIQPRPTTRRINMTQVASDPKLRNSGIYSEQWKYLTGDDTAFQRAQDPQDGDNPDPPGPSGGPPPGGSRPKRPREEDDDDQGGGGNGMDDDDDDGDGGPDGPGGSAPKKTRYRGELPDLGEEVPVPAEIEELSNEEFSDVDDESEREFPSRSSHGKFSAITDDSDLGSNTTPGSTRSTRKGRLQDSSYGKAPSLDPVSEEVEKLVGRHRGGNPTQINPPLFTEAYTILTAEEFEILDMPTGEELSTGEGVRTSSIEGQGPATLAEEDTPATATRSGSPATSTVPRSLFQDPSSAPASNFGTQPPMIGSGLGKSTPLEAPFGNPDPALGSNSGGSTQSPARPNKKILPKAIMRAPAMLEFEEFLRLNPNGNVSVADAEAYRAARQAEESKLELKTIRTEQQLELATQALAASMNIPGMRQAAGAQQQSGGNGATSASETSTQRSGMQPPPPGAMMQMLERYGASVKDLQRDFREVVAANRALEDTNAQLQEELEESRNIEAALRLGGDTMLKSDCDAQLHEINSELEDAYEESARSREENMTLQIELDAFKRNQAKHPLTGDTMLTSECKIKLDELEERLRRADQSLKIEHQNRVIAEEESKRLRAIIEGDDVLAPKVDGSILKSECDQLIKIARARQSFLRAKTVEATNVASRLLGERDNLTRALEKCEEAHETKARELLDPDTVLRSDVDTLIEETREAGAAIIPPLYERIEELEFEVRKLDRELRIRKSQKQPSTELDLSAHDATLADIDQHLAKSEILTLKEALRECEAKNAAATSRAPSSSCDDKCKQLEERINALKQKIDDDNKLSAQAAKVASDRIAAYREEITKFRGPGGKHTWPIHVGTIAVNESLRRTAGVHVRRIQEANSEARKLKEENNKRIAAYQAQVAELKQKNKITTEQLERLLKELNKYLPPNQSHIPGDIMAEIDKIEKDKEPMISVADCNKAKLELRKEYSILQNGARKTNTDNADLVKQVQDLKTTIRELEDAMDVMTHKALDLDTTIIDLQRELNDLKNQSTDATSSTGSTTDGMVSRAECTALRKAAIQVWKQRHDQVLAKYTALQGSGALDAVHKQVLELGNEVEDRDASIKTLENSIKHLQMQLTVCQERAQSADQTSRPGGSQASGTGTGNNSAELEHWKAQLKQCREEKQALATTFEGAAAQFQGAAKQVTANKKVSSLIEMKMNAKIQKHDELRQKYDQFKKKYNDLMDENRKLRRDQAGVVAAAGSSAALDDCEEDKRKLEDELADLKARYDDLLAAKESDRKNREVEADKCRNEINILTGQVESLVKRRARREGLEREPEDRGDDVGDDGGVVGRPDDERIICDFAINGIIAALSRVRTARAMGVSDEGALNSVRNAIQRAYDIVPRILNNDRETRNVWAARVHVWAGILAFFEGQAFPAITEFSEADRYRLSLPDGDQVLLDLWSRHNHAHKAPTKPGAYMTGDEYNARYRQNDQLVRGPARETRQARRRVHSANAIIAQAQDLALSVSSVADRQFQLRQAAKQTRRARRAARLASIVEADGEAE